MELEELHVLQRHAGTQRHGHAVPGIDQRVGIGAEDLPGATRGDQRGARQDHQPLAAGDIQQQRTEHHALVVGDQVNGKVFIEEMRTGADVLLVQGLQDGMAGAVGGRAGAGGLLAAEVHALPAEPALVDGAVLEPGKRYAVVLQFIYGLRCGPAHVLDGILVAQVIAALDRVEHVPVPVVRADVGQRRVDAALRRHGMGTGRKHLGYHRDMGIGP